MNERIQHKIEERIHQILAEAIRRDLSDPRLELALPSITRVKLAPDLSVVHVSVSVLGEPGAATACWQGILSGRKFLQGCLGRHLQLRTTPQLMLHLDESLKKAAEVLDQISQAMKDIRTEGCPENAGPTPESQAEKPAGSAD